MPQKKTNAYMCFVMEWKEKHGQGLSVPEAVKRCNSLWSQLSEKQKTYYKEKAKKEPSLPGKLRPKLTSDGIPVDLIEKQQREAARKEEQMIAAIKNTVKHSLNNNKLLDENFYFISFNFFVRQLNSDIYVPAEVALAEFSLKNGIKRTYHAFTNPKDVLYANVFDAKHHADTTHQLPLPPEAMGDKDLEEIFFDIVQFIQSDDGGQQQANYPPLYTLEKETGMIISCLEYLQAVDDTEMPISLRIYSLEHLFFNLKLAACEYSGNDNVPANKFISDAVLDRDLFEYESNISCLYHEDIDRTKYCPLSKVIRWGYYFADYMGKDVNLNFVPGKHLPDRYDAVKINEDVQESLRSETESVASALSNLSISSAYNTCDEGVTASTRSSKSQILPKKVVPTATLIRQNNLSVDVLTEVAAVSNHWKRLDMSAAPDLTYFDIEENQASSINISRRSYGRGIAVLDDDFPSLVSIGRGRGVIKPA